MQGARSQAHAVGVAGRQVATTVQPSGAEMKVNRIQFQAVLSMPIFFKDHEIEGQCEQAPSTFRKVTQ